MGLEKEWAGEGGKGQGVYMFCTWYALINVVEVWI